MTSRISSTSSSVSAKRSLIPSRKRSGSARPRMIAGSMSGSGSTDAGRSFWTRFDWLLASSTNPICPSASDGKIFFRKMSTDLRPSGAMCSSNSANFSWLRGSAFGNRYFWKNDHAISVHKTRSSNCVGSFFARTTKAPSGLPPACSKSSSRLEPSIGRFFDQFQT